MNAPLIWIVLPLLAAGLLALLPRERWITILGTLLVLALAGLAFWLPPNAVQRLGPLSLRMDATFGVFGRQISLTPADEVALILVYSIAGFWFFGTLAVGSARRIIPAGLAVIALLVASLAVEPFLYAALLIEMAVLLAIPILVEPRKKPGRGLLRFITYQTLAMPFILLAGFLLSGVEAGPSDAALIKQAALLLGLGFACLLSVFPLYTWVVMLSEECLPYAVGFIVSIFPTFGLVFGLSFIDRYSWLRDSAVLSTGLQALGLLTLVSAGVWAAFQRHLGRIFGFAAAAEMGLSLLAMSLPDRQAGLQILFFLLVPRALAFGVWTIALSVLRSDHPDLTFTSIHGQARSYPLAAAGLVLAQLALAGTPLFASFPVRQALWEKLAQQSTSAALLFGLASLGLWIGALRSMAVLTMAPEQTPWKLGESWAQIGLIGLGLLGLFLFGVFPQWAQALLANLPGMFVHLGQ